MSKDKEKKVATVNPEDNDVVVASKFHISDLWKVEDWWTIWIGFFIIALAIISVVTNIFPSEGPLTYSAAKFGTWGTP